VSLWRGRAGYTPHTTGMREFPTAEGGDLAGADTHQGETVRHGGVPAEDDNISKSDRSPRVRATRRRRRRSIIRCHTERR